MKTSTMLATARQPLTTLSKVLVGIQFFLALGALAGTLATHSPALATVTAVWLVSGIITLMGFRWAPIFGTVISGGGLIYTLTDSPYPQYHLSHPKDPLFAPIVIAVALTGIVFAAMLASVAQNYWEPDRHTPRWFGFIATGVIGMALGGIIIGAISPAPVTDAASVANDGSPIAHLGFNTFTPIAITVPQGMKLKIVDDSNIPHTLTYGQWSGNTTQVTTPANAPALGTHAISSGSFEIGPFTTPGVYHILCIVHPGMEITVTVP